MMLRRITSFLIFFALFLALVGTYTPSHAAENIDFQCIGRAVATYSDNVVTETSRLGLSKVKLISPVFNLTHGNRNDMISSYLAASTKKASLAAYAGNIYNTKDSTISQYMSSLPADFKGKPLMITEAGAYELNQGSTNKPAAIARLSAQLGWLNSSASGYNLLGVMLFNVFGVRGPSEFDYGIMTDDEATIACSGLGPNKCGSNSAGYFVTGGGTDTSYPRTNRITNMKYVVEISNGDINPIKEALALANQHGALSIVIRIGTQQGVDNYNGKSLKYPGVYAQFLKEVDKEALKYPNVKVYAVAGPNEPESECWASAHCGCGVPYDEEDEPILITGTVRSSAISNGKTNFIPKGVVVKAWTGTWDDCGPNGTCKKNGFIVDQAAYSPTCSVIGRKFDSHQGLLGCEKLNLLQEFLMLNPQAGKYIKPNGDATADGRFNIVTMRGMYTPQNFNYVSFSCNGQLKDLYRIDLSEPIIELDISPIDCGEMNVPYEPPPELGYVNKSGFLSCELGPSKDIARAATPVNLNETKSVVDIFGRDPSYFGKTGDDIPEAALVGGATLPVRHAEVTMTNSTIDRGSMFDLFGSGFGLKSLPTPKQGATEPLPNCNNFKMCNSGVSSDPQGITNTLTCYGPGVSLLPPGYMESLYRSVPKDTTVCHLNGDSNNVVKLGEIQPPWASAASGFRLSSDYFPYWYLFGCMETALETGISVRTDDDSYDSSQVRGSPFIAGSSGTVGETPFAEGLRTIFPTGPLGEFSKRRVECVMSDNVINYSSLGGKPVDIFDSPYVTDLSTELNMKTLGKGVFRIGVMDEACTYNTANGIDPVIDSNNDFRGNTTHKAAALAIFQNKEEQATNSVFGTPLGDAKTFFSGVVSSLKSFFTIHLGNKPKFNDCIPIEKQKDSCVLEQDLAVGAEICTVIGSHPAPGRPLNNCNFVPAGCIMTSFTEDEVEGGYTCPGDMDIQVEFSRNIEGLPNQADSHQELNQMQRIFAQPFEDQLEVSCQVHFNTDTSATKAGGKTGQGVEQAMSCANSYYAYNSYGGDPTFASNIPIPAPGVGSEPSDPPDDGSSNPALGNSCAGLTTPALVPPWSGGAPTPLPYTYAPSNHAPANAADTPLLAGESLVTPYFGRNSTLMQTVITNRQNAGLLPNPLPAGIVGYAAMLRPSDIGRQICVTPRPGFGGATVGPILIVDTGRSDHSQCLVYRGWGLDLDSEGYAALGARPAGFSLKPAVITNAVNGNCL